MKKIAIFASGSGTNAQKIIEHLNKMFDKKVALVCTNNPNAYVIERARQANIPVMVFSREEWARSNKVRDRLLSDDIDLIVLAGFLWLVPNEIVRSFPDRIINIHPALLPKYGGKGMYGFYVHRSVLENHEKESGITIHYVNERYDEGKIIFQARCEVKEDDTPEQLANRIHELEYEHYPRVVEEILDRIG